MRDPEFRKGLDDPEGTQANLDKFLRKKS